MKTASLQLLADDLADTAERLASSLSEGSRRLSEAMLGQPGARTLDGVVRNGSGPSDPTAAAGCADDPARVDEVRLQRNLAGAHREARLALDIIDRYLPRPATTRERRAVSRANSWRCWSCARIDRSLPVPDAQIPHTRTPTTVKGNLPEPRLLCRWCYGVVGASGRLPSRKEVRAHLKGDRVLIPERKSKGANRVRM